MAWQPVLPILDSTDVHVTCEVSTAEQEEPVHPLASDDIQPKAEDAGAAAEAPTEARLCCEDCRQRRSPSSRVCKARSGGGGRTGRWAAASEDFRGDDRNKRGLTPQSSPSSDELTEPNDLGEHCSMLQEDGRADGRATALGREDVEGVGLGDGAALGSAFDCDGDSSIGTGVDAEVEAGVRRKFAMTVQNSSRSSELAYQ